MTTPAADEEAKAKPVQKSNIKYITRQAPTDWTAEALIGRTVENANGDNLGEINNVIINEKGDVVAVVIGVGGFLGIGEKNVGVPFEQLDFRTAEAIKDRTDKHHEGGESRAEDRRDGGSLRYRAPGHPHRAEHDQGRSGSRTRLRLARRAKRRERQSVMRSRVQ